MAVIDDGQTGEFLKQTTAYGINYKLDGISHLMERMGNVQEQLRIIHVAGTNGKGSVCAMLARILTEAGYRTGLYLSPAVFAPQEVIQIDGRPISKEDYTAAVSSVQQACAQMLEAGLRHPTSFEVETAAAFWYFNKKQCAYVVLEAGLGGAKDATNLITHPLCSVITSIGRDHMAMLGDSVEKIAQAKAGIMKPGCPCVSSAQKPEVMETLRAAAKDAGCTLRAADPALLSAYTYDGQHSMLEIPDTGDGKTLRCPLTGACQKDNITCVLETVRLLQEQGIGISKQAVRRGLERVSLPGRMEQIARQPDFYIDGAHNEAAAYCLRETVRNCFAGRRLVYIIGVFADKEYEKVLELTLPYAARVFTVTPDHPRALDGQALAKRAGRFHPAVTYAARIPQAAACAAKAAGADGVVLAFGSFSYLGELRQAVRDGIW